MTSAPAPCPTLAPPRRRRPPAAATAAFTLIEVTLALGITAFCLIPLLGMLPIGLQNDLAATEQTSANAILSAVASDLRAVAQTAPAGQSATSEQFGIVIPAVNGSAPAVPYYFTAEGKCTTSAATPNLRYQLNVSFPANASTATGASTVSRSATFATLQVSWPAAATVAQASGKVSTFVALNRN